MNTSKKIQDLSQSSQSGFTIIESLMAIIVVSVLLVGLAPFFALAVGVRVQAKRVETATQAAKTYIDGLKSGNIIPPKMTTTTLYQYQAPSSGALSCSSPGYCPAPAPLSVNSTTDIFCVPGNGHSTCTSNNFKDMIIQAVGQIQTTDVSKGYRSYLLGVRVYRADAFGSNRTFIAGTTQSSANGTTGLSSSQAPLVEMTTQKAVTDATQFQKLCKAAGINSGC